MDWTKQIARVQNLLAVAQHSYENEEDEELKRGHLFVMQFMEELQQQRIKRKPVLFRRDNALRYYQ